MKEKHLLQSSVWAEYEKLEGRQVFERAGEGWSVACWLNETPVGNYLMAAYGPWVEEEAKFAEAFRALSELAAENEAFFVRIEPTFEISGEKLKKIAAEQGMTLKKVKEIEPEHTWVLDLTQPREDLVREMESNKIRSWRNMGKRGMSVRKTSDPEEISILSKLLAGVGERDHFTPQDENHLRNQMKAGFATLYVVEVEEGDGAAGGAAEAGVGAETGGAAGVGAGSKSAAEKKEEKSVEKGCQGVDNREESKKIPIAAALIYEHDGVSYYAHAGTDENFRKLRAGAVLLVQTILDAQENGGRVYDFWGITTSEDPKHPWYGFTQFKKSFGGHQVDYAGTYDLILSEKKYKLYNTLRKANLWARKLRK